MESTESTTPVANDVLHFENQDFSVSQLYHVPEPVRLHRIRLCLEGKSGRATVVPIRVAEAMRTLTSCLSAMSEPFRAYSHPGRQELVCDLIRRFTD